MVGLEMGCIERLNLDDKKNSDIFSIELLLIEKPSKTQ